MTKRKPQRIKMGSEGEIQMRMDLVEIEGIPVLSELQKFREELYQGMPGAPPFNEFLGRLAYEGMLAIKARLKKIRSRALQT
jgi:hypothetical protein